jgi:hypothetical protein
MDPPPAVIPRARRRSSIRDFTVEFTLDSDAAIDAQSHCRPALDKSRHATSRVPRSVCGSGRRDAQGVRLSASQAVIAKGVTVRVALPETNTIRSDRAVGNMQNLLQVKMPQ